MASSSLLVLALIVFVGHVNCQFGFNRGQEDPLAEGCENKVMDFYFVLDSSSSIHINDYLLELQFARDVISRLDVRQDATRIGALSFSDDYQRPTIRLNRFSSRADALASINNQSLPYRTGVTNTDLAIRYVNELNEFREDITKVMVVVTDGGSRSPGATAAESNRARENGFYMFVVGIGQYLDDQEWRAIANDPDDQFLYNITNYRFLDNVKFSLPPRACSLPPIILRETCTVNQPSEVFFVASQTASPDAIQMINYFKQNTRDQFEDLRLSYLIDACGFESNRMVRDDEEVCDSFRRGPPETPDDIDNLFTRARTIARESREAGGRQPSQTIVLFVDDATMSASGSSWGQESSSAQQYEGIQVVVVDLGLRRNRGFLNRLTQNRQNIVSYLGNSLANQRQSRNNYVERVCSVLNIAGGNFNGNIN